MQSALSQYDIYYDVSTVTPNAPNSKTVIKIKYLTMSEMALFHCKLNHAGFCLTTLLPPT